MIKKFTFPFLFFVSLIVLPGVLDGQNFSLLSAVRAQNDNELNVTAEFLKKQKDKAFAPRKGATGERPKGLVVPKELMGDGVTKQKAKLAEMVKDGYKQPMDFADLAEKRLNGELVELPMATESYFLDIGGSTTEDEFSSFSFEEGSVVLKPDSPRYLTLKKLADDFGGTKYDLTNPKDRRQMRIRLLRMVSPRAKATIEEVAAAYLKKFNRPLRLVSMIRSMDYQIQLNATDPSTFVVRGAGSLPPHTSGCAFDIARKHLTAEEQNFIMKKLAEMEQQGKMDALIEYGVNACFHIFVYADGKPPEA